MDLRPLGKRLHAAQRGLITQNFAPSLTPIVRGWTGTI